jgi:hypothetical protein
MNRREFFKRSATLVGGAAALLCGVKPKTVAASPALTLAKLKEAKAILDAADVPKDDRYVWHEVRNDGEVYGRSPMDPYLDVVAEHNRLMAKALSEKLDRRIMEAMK